MLPLPPLSRLRSPMAAFAVAISLVGGGLGAAAVLPACGGDEQVEKKGPPPEAKKIGDNRFEVPRDWLSADGDAAWYGKNPQASLQAFDSGSWKGVKVTGVRAGSRADKMGVKEGDVFRSVNGKETLDVDHLIDAVTALSSATTFTFEIARQGQPVTLIYEVR